MTRSPWLVRSIGLSAALVLAVGCHDDPLRPSDHAVVRPAENVVVSAGADFSDGAGKLWHQPAATTNLSWAQVAQLCPRDGLTPCVGSIGAMNFSGWVWATGPEVIQLMSLWAPAILTSPTSSVNDVFAGIGFVSVFTATEWFANTYQSSESVYGWTASMDASGNPVGGGGGWSTPPHAGGVGVGAVPGAGAASTVRGVFLWRADGSDGRLIVANNDSGTVAEPNGGIAIVDVLANDVLAGAPATVPVVTIAQLSSNTSGVSINPVDGSVNVASGTSAGSATLVYRICESANPSNCAQASVAVRISGNVVDAVDDAGTTRTGGGIVITNVRANDVVGVPTTLAVVSSTAVGVSLDNIGGSVAVAAGTAAGSYILTYRLCETASPTNCDTARALVTVVNNLIVATNDQGGAPSSTGGAAISSVLTNDKLDGATASLANVTLSQISTGNPGITLDVSDGSVDVAPMTQSGSYTVQYQICERAMPNNCAAASAVVTVAPQSLVVSSTSLTVREGTRGAFTVRLSQMPVTPVVVTVAFYAGTATLAPVPTTLTFTAANWSTPLSVSFTAPKDSDRNDNAATIHLSATGVVVTAVVVKIVDINRSAANPTATLAAPLNGQTVSGLVDVWGTGTVSSGTLVDGKFSVDGGRIYTDTNASGTYRIAGKWNSSTVANGWHVLELRVTDSVGKDGRMLITVLVNN